MGEARVAHEPASGRLSLIIPHLGRLRRAKSQVVCSRPEGKAGLRYLGILLRNHTCVRLEIASPPTQAQPASRTRHLPAARLCMLLLGPQYPCHGAHGQGRDTRVTRQTIILPAKNSVDHGSHPWGKAGHSGPTGPHRGPGVLVLEHLFPFSYQRGPDCPVVSSTPRRLGFCCLWSK